MADADTLKGLEDALSSGSLKDETLSAYYDGSQRLEHIGIAVPPELRRFETVVNWPRMTVDALEERLDIEGFRLGGSDEGDARLWEVWQANNLDEESQLGHLDAFIFGRSFACVGANEAEKATPIVTVESPREMIATTDPRTHKVAAAARFYQVANGRPTLATLYEKDYTSWLTRSGDGDWSEYDRDDHRLGVVPVVPLVNRRRTGRAYGVSELADIIPLTDAACRSLTNLQIAAETHSVPQRYVLGASKGDFVDADGNQLTAWEAYFGAYAALANSDAKMGQFTASDLRNFHDTVNHYARLVAALTGLPPHYLGFTTDNPASADAIRSSESRLVKRAERKQRTFGGSWEQVMRLVLRVADGDWDPRARSLETKWRDPSTPTYAAKADAVVKLVGSGILPIEIALEDMGYSDTRIKRIMDARQRQLDSDVLGSLAEQFRQPAPEPT